MECPVYVLAPEHSIPIPSANIHLVLDPDERTYYRSVDVAISGSTLHSKQLAIAISRGEDPRILMSSPPEYIDNVYSIGVICKVLQEVEDADGLLVTLHVEGRAFVNLAAFEDDGHTWIESAYVEEDFLNEEAVLPPDITSMSNMILKNPKLFSQSLREDLEDITDPTAMMNVMAHHLLSTTETRLGYLQDPTNVGRWLLIGEAISDVLTGARKKTKRKLARTKNTQSTTQERVVSSGPKSFAQRAKDPNIPPKIRDLLQEEVARLERIPDNSLEASMATDYLTWALGLPWGVYSRKSKIDLNELRAELDKNHYGLEDVKDYLVEHICIEQLKQKPSGAVICLTGPPGTGKSSIAESLAIASGREFIRIALGGVSDETDLRGHRRTYIASRPGRIIAGLKKAKTMDPVVLLDEVDKVAQGSRGAVMSALLELLDPEQNPEFTDRYLDFPVDLSQVMFICTANYEEQIAAPLMDRMELIRFRDYTSEERTIILDKYILPKIVEDYATSSLDITWAPEILDALAAEKQVRQMEKKARRLLRMAATAICLGKVDSQVIDSEFSSGILKVKQSWARTPIGFG